jgi:replicative DNA helicase
LSDIYIQQLNRTESLILKELIHNPQFAENTRNHLNTDLWDNPVAQHIYDFVEECYSKYKAPPTSDQLEFWSEEQEGFGSLHPSIVQAVGELSNPYTGNTDPSTDICKKWIRERSISNAMLRAEALMQKEFGRLDDTYEGKSMLRELGRQTLLDAAELISSAYSMSFDEKVGFSPRESAAEYAEWMTREEKYYSTGVPILDKHLDGGIPQEGLGFFLAPTNGGKSTVMASITTHLVKTGHDVLYITCEMTRKATTTRILGNLSNFGMSAIKKASKEMVHKLAEKEFDTSDGRGEFLVERFEASAASTADVKQLIQNVIKQRGWKPQVVFLDYMGLINSSRLNSDHGSYAVFKAVSEELRGIAAHFEIPIVTAAQTNRNGMESGVPQITEIADSSGPLMTADWVVGVAKSDAADGQLMMATRKLRDGEKDDRTFVVGIDWDKMRLFDNDDPTYDHYADILQPSSNGEMTLKKSGSPFERLSY